MTPLPANNTERLFVDYAVAGYEHTLGVRLAEATTDADAVENVSAFLEIVGAFCYPTTVLGARRGASGSPFTYPIAWGGIPSWGTGTAIPAVSAQFYDFVGRSDDGRRVNVTLFGAGLLTSGGDYRITPSEASWVQDALDSLVSDAGVFLTISEEIPFWKAYANCGVNAYWRNKIR